MLGLEIARRPTPAVLRTLVELDQICAIITGSSWRQVDTSSAGPDILLHRAYANV